MAQTIAVRSGSVTHTWRNDQNSYTTLFTQSTGTATRVILNQLGFYNTSYNGPIHSVGVYVYCPTTGQRTPAFVYKNTGNYAANFAFFSGSTHQGGIGGTSNGATWTAQHVMFGTNTDRTVGEEQPSNKAGGYGYYTTDYVINPGSIYIGNGDSLQVHGYWGTAAGGCYYSFTTITES
jgi:hypothetical protein